MTVRLAGEDFSAVTELPGHGATREQLSMLYTRYHLARRLAVGKDVLEVACGAGIGLRYLARGARFAVGGDYDGAILRAAARTPPAPLVRLDAHAMPFDAATFDVVVVFEALYYLNDPVRVMGEARRVLRPSGTIVLCVANPESPGFVPSLRAHRYFDAQDLREMLQACGFAPEVYGAFRADPGSAWEGIVLTARRAAAALHLIPPTLRGRGWLKRLAYGRLLAIPSEVSEGMAPLAPLEPVDGVSADVFKVLYAVGRIP